MSLRMAAWLDDTRISVISVLPGGNVEAAETLRVRAPRTTRNRARKPAGENARMSGQDRPMRHFRDVAGLGVGRERGRDAKTIKA